MKRNWLYNAAILLFAALALLAGSKIWSIAAQYRAAEESSDELQQYIAAPTRPAALPVEISPDPEPTSPGETAPETEPATEPTAPAVEYPSVDFEGLLQVNEDVVGWICIEDTKINYPIVQGDDNQYYVSHMADGRANAAGSIFMDCRNAPDFSDRHSVIYGHNMRNGSMFAQISYYKNPEFLAGHPTGMIMTPEGNFQFEIIAGYVASVDDPAWQVRFDTDEDFLLWLQETMARSIFSSEAVPTAEDRILTLSTCSYEFRNARFVLVCRILP